MISTVDLVFDSFLSPKKGKLPVYLNMAGFRKEEIKVTVENGLCTVTAKPSEDNPFKSILGSYKYSTYVTNPDNIMSKYENGVLVLDYKDKELVKKEVVVE